MSWRAGFPSDSCVECGAELNWRERPRSSFCSDRCSKRYRDRERRQMVTEEDRERERQRARAYYARNRERVIARVKAARKRREEESRE